MEQSTSFYHEFTTIGGKTMAIALVRYSPFTSAPALTSQLIESYRDVFADTPWHEWLKCQVDDKDYWGKKDAGLLASMDYLHCEKPVIDFYPRNEVIETLRKEINPSSSCWLAMDGEKVIGFIWGYPANADELNEKLHIDLSQWMVQNNLKTVAYQSEMGIDPAYRGQKIAKRLLISRHEDFLAQGLEVGIVRTRQFPEASVTYLWFTDLGYKIIYSYPGDDGRVILARPLAGLQEEIVNHHRK